MHEDEEHKVQTEETKCYGFNRDHTKHRKCELNCLTGGGGGGGSDGFIFKRRE